MNLLAETHDKLLDYDLTPQEVLWIGSSDGTYSMTWQKFEVLADQRYDNGYGGQEVCSDLVVVGEDWWLERHEYDGMEWWEFKRKPICKLDDKPVTKVFGDFVE